MGQKHAAWDRTGTNLKSPKESKRNLCARPQRYGERQGMIGVETSSDFLAPVTGQAIADLPRSSIGSG